MILAPIEDRRLRQVVRRAALPEEDVLHRMADVARALNFGYPRLLACRSEDLRRLRGLLDLGRRRLPVLAIRGPNRWGREEGGSADGFAIFPVDEASVRLRNLMEEAADSPCQAAMERCPCFSPIPASRSAISPIAFSGEISRKEPLLSFFSGLSRRSGW